MEITRGMGVKGRAGEGRKGKKLVGIAKQLPYSGICDGALWVGGDHSRQHCSLCFALLQKFGQVMKLPVHQMDTGASHEFEIVANAHIHWTSEQHASCPVQPFLKRHCPCIAGWTEMAAILPCEAPPPLQITCISIPLCECLNKAKEWSSCIRFAFVSVGDKKSWRELGMNLQKLKHIVSVSIVNLPPIPVHESCSYPLGLSWELGYSG